jgi:hypothetical protein
MQHLPVSDPFALIMDPDAVFQAMERSDRLGGLKRRICRPLDKPLIPKVDDEAEAFDQEVDAAPEAPDALDF